MTLLASCVFSAACSFAILVSAPIIACGFPLKIDWANLASFTKSLTVNPVSPIGVLPAPVKLDAFVNAAIQLPLLILLTKFTA